MLALYTSAYCSEIVRGGVEAVPQTTRRAARSLGLTWWQDMVEIVFPLALRVMFPSWIGLTLGVMKDTSLVAWIGVIELLKSSQILITRMPNEPLVHPQHRRADLLPDQLPDLPARRQARAEVARK